MLVLNQNVELLLLLKCFSCILGCVSVGVDLIFLLDSSGSIGASRYAQMLEFVKNLVSVLDIGPDQTRVGVTVYSSSVETSFLLNTYFDKKSLVDAVGNLPYFNSGTNTATGLREVSYIALRKLPVATCSLPSPCSVRYFLLPVDNK